MLLLMISNCSKCGREEAVSCITYPGAQLTAVLPTRWRDTVGGVVCDRCDHGVPANVILIRKNSCAENASKLADTPCTHLCSPRGSIPRELRAA